MLGAMYRLASWFDGAKQMGKVLRWIAHGMLSNVPHLSQRRRAARGDDPVSVFEQIDAASLGEHDFRVSSSMRMGDAALSDFAETLPSCNYGPADRYPSQGSLR